MHDGKDVLTVFVDGQQPDRRAGQARKAAGLLQQRREGLERTSRRLSKHKSARSLSWGTAMSFNVRASGRYGKR